MLVTRQNHIPLPWLFMITIPWVVFYFMILTGGLSFLILNRLIDNPATLTFVVSLPGLILTFLPIGSYVNYMSDRIWTRWGRRKIFLLIWSAGSALVAILYPLAPNVTVFLGIMFLGAIFGLFGGPFEALKLEIVPSEMRGRSAAMGSWVSTAMNIAYYAAVIGCFNEVLPVWGRSINGVTLIYWCLAAASGILVFFYLFGIHEIKPTSTLTGEKFSFKKAWAAMTMPQLRYLYVFIIATVMVNASLGSMGMLLYINQWGYSMQEFGRNVAIGGFINLFLIPLAGIFADKGKNHRMTIWIICILIVKAFTLGTFLYYTCYLPDQRPTLVEIVFFSEVTAVFGLMAGMIYYPLVYDYVPRNLMGTYCAGAGIVGSITSYCTINGLGLFLYCWGSLFQPPAGEMMRVCLKQERPQTQVEQFLHEAGLATPAGGKAANRDVSVQPWYANGIVSDHGVCYEFRLRDNDGAKKMKRRDALKSEIETLASTLTTNRNSGSAATSLSRQEKELDAMRTEQAALDSELATRIEFWRREVLRGLGDQLMPEGSEILASTTTPAVVSQVAVTHKPTAAAVDKINKLLRAGDPSSIGVTIVRRDHDFALSVATLLPAGRDPQSTAERICQQVAQLANMTTPGLVITPCSVANAVVKPAVITDFALVEDPSRNFVSPVTRLVNALLVRFTELPTPDQKLHSLADSLSKGGRIGHARADALQNRNGVRITAVAADEKLDDLETWIKQMREKVRGDCASLKLTVLTPLIGKDVLPMKYNYMSGYLYTFALVAIGLILVVYFIYKERAGVVRKWGAEESQAAKQDVEEKKLAAAATAKASATPLPAETYETYTPGYLLPKVVFALLGMVVLVMGGMQAWPDLRLLATGERTEAIVVEVVARKQGQPDLTLRTQSELDAHEKTVSNAKDYNWTFFDVFAFETGSGHEIRFLRPVGSKLKPPMSLLDDDGLPTTATVLYDLRNPARSVLPYEHSSWLAPALTGFMGLIMVLVGGVFAWFARKPIRLSGSADINLTS